MENNFAINDEDVLSIKKAFNEGSKITADTKTFDSVSPEIATKERNFTQTLNHQSFLLSLYYLIYRRN